MYYIVTHKDIRSNPIGPIKYNLIGLRRRYSYNWRNIEDDVMKKLKNHGDKIKINYDFNTVLTIEAHDE